MSSWLSPTTPLLRSNKKVSQPDKSPLKKWKLHLSPVHRPSNFSLDRWARVWKWKPWGFLDRWRKGRGVGKRKIVSRLVWNVIRLYTPLPPPNERQGERSQTISRSTLALKLRANGRNNSQHRCANNVGSCCVRISSSVQTDATTAVHRGKNTTHKSL